MSFAGSSTDTSQTIATAQGVNQRRFTTSTNVNNIWCVDGWYINGGQGTQTLTQNGLLFNNNGITGSVTATIQQSLSLINSELTGKLITMSILIDNNLYSVSAVVPARTDSA